jgi:hypothetical protein
MENRLDKQNPLPTTPSTKKQTQFFDRLFLEGTLVEGELLTLEDVSVDTSALTGAGRDAGQKTTGSELGLKGGVDLSVHLASGKLALNRLRLGGRLSSGSGLLGLRATLLSEGETVVGLVPLTEGGSIDLNDGGLGQGVRTCIDALESDDPAKEFVGRKLTDKLVVGRVVGDSNDTGLLGNTLRAPREVTRVQAETTELAVATTGADDVNT